MNQWKQFLNGVVLGNYFAAGLIGLVSGVISGLFGVGGGVILVPAMMFFMGMGIHHAVGTSLAVIIPTALIGTWKHHQLGNVEWRVFLTLFPMGMVGGWAGAWLASQIPAANLKRAFGGFLVLIGLRLLLAKS